MTQKNKVISRLAVDLSGAVIGFVIGMLCLQFFRSGLSLPLENTDWLILISSTFVFLLLASVFHKFIGRYVTPSRN